MTLQNRVLLSPHYYAAAAAAAATAGGGGGRRQKHLSGASIVTLPCEGSLVISPPTNFVKASPEELRQQLLRNGEQCRLPAPHMPVAKHNFEPEVSPINSKGPTFPHSFLRFKVENTFMQPRKRGKVCYI